MHLRRGDWGRPQLAGRGQKIYQSASDLPRAQYVLGRGEKICLALLGENVNDAYDAELRMQLEREGKFEGRGGGCRRGEQDGRKKEGDFAQDSP